MPTFTFRGRDMSEAVEQVRNTLGSDAVIIDTVRGTDHIGRFVEITATGELKPQQPEVPQVATQPQYRGRPQPRPGSPIPPPRGGARGPGRPAPAPRGRPSNPSAGYRGRVGDVPAPQRQRPRHEPSYQQPPQQGYRPAPAPREHLPSQGLPGMKGGDRYQPPNAFSSARDVIIPQPAPSAAQAQQALAPNHRSAGGYPAPSAPAMSGRATSSASPDSPAQLRSPARGPSRPQAPNAQAGPTHPGRQATTPSADATNVAQPPSGAEGSLDATLQAMSQGLGAQGADAMRFVTDRLGEIVSYIQTSQTTGGMPAPVFDHLRQFTHQLQAAGIASEYAAELIEETKARLRLNQLDKQVILAQLGQVLAQNISCVDPLKGFEGEKNVLAFIGPTGVGKTTTIAKIAAHAHLTHEMPVTLISTDTFRMAAVEQLSRYAEILDCPTSAARNPEELWELVEKASTPLVLVDSTGRNPRTPGQLKLLSKLFGEGWKGRTVLTVAANTREQDLKPIVEGFKPLKYDMVSITKLDETYALGTVYNVSKYTQCPVAWTTNGQRVPEDIELANAEALAVKIIMEAISHKV